MGVMINTKYIYIYIYEDNITTNSYNKKGSKKVPE